MASTCRSWISSTHSESYEVQLATVISDVHLPSSPSVNISDLKCLEPSGEKLISKFLRSFSSIKEYLDSFLRLIGGTSVTAEAGMLLGKDLEQGAKFKIPLYLGAEPVFTSARDVHHTLPCKKAHLML